MEQATSLKLVASIDGATAAQAAPTVNSDFVSLVDVGGLHYGRARAVFGAPTLAGTVDSASVTLWAREGSTIVPVETVDLGSNDLFDSVDLGVCPPSWSFFATLSEVTGTGADVTVDVYVQRYTEYN